jgi:hypothetical protein
LQSSGLCWHDFWLIGNVVAPKPILQQPSDYEIKKEIHHYARSVYLSRGTHFSGCSTNELKVPERRQA